MTTPVPSSVELTSLASLLTRLFSASFLAMPLRVTVRRQDDMHGGDGDGEGLVREMFVPETVVDANGDEPPGGARTVVMKLQTMERGEGYWRDTGNLELRGGL